MKEDSKAIKTGSGIDTAELKRQQLEALERNFHKFSRNLGEHTWKREDLYDRPSKWNSSRGGEKRTTAK